MNYKILFMQFTSYLKRFAPVLGVLVVLVAVFNFGSYDPYNELSTISPDAVMAAGGFVLTDTKSGTECGSDCGGGTIITCNVSSSVNTVVPGGSINISWQTSGASIVTLNNQAVGPSGSHTFTNIQNNTTYTLLATSVDGSVNCRSTVTVVCLIPPACVLDASETLVEPGGRSILTWTSTNANPNSASFNQGIGNVPTSGFRQVFPTVTTTYVLTVTGANNQTANCSVTITVTTVTPTAPTCDSFTASPVSGAPGSQRTLTWTTSNANTASISQGVGPVSVNGSTFVNPTVNTLYTLTIVGANNQTANCSVAVTVTAVVPTAPTCDSFTASPVSGAPGSQRTLTWTTSNANTASISQGVGPVSVNGSTFVNPTVNTLYTLTIVGANNQTANCSVAVTVTAVVPTAPTCDSFTASPVSGAPGSQRTLTWTTSNANTASISQGVGPVSVNGSTFVNPSVTTTYTLLVSGDNNQTTNCSVTVIVTAAPLAPVCLSFTATPISGAPGSQRTLTWTTSNANTASISQGVGPVSVNGSTSVNPSVTTTYTLFLVGANNETSNCNVTVTVVVPTQLTCENNVTFTANPNSIRRGDSSTLTWNTTGVTSLRFDNGITATGLSGSVTVEPSNSTTYNLIATSGNNTINCPVTVSVSTGGGGGGGGSPTPRCELSVSKNRITLGQSVELTWESSNATGLTLEDRTARKTLVDTDGLSVRDRERLLDDNLTVSPKRDTTYLLTVTRGSKERTCTVDVRVGDNVVVTQVRDQQPLVSGIALTQVPYTGFEAGPILTVLFYLLLMAWALYIAYILVIKRDTLGGLKLASVNHNDSEPIFHYEYVSPKILVSQNTAIETPLSFMPANLPVAPVVVGYASLATQTEGEEKNIRNMDEDEMTTLENYAHARKILISSDAVRHFVATTNSVAERTEALDQVIKAAKEKFPAEDGWVVLNEKRMQDLCVICSVNQAAAKPEAAYIPSVVPTGAGSLAEAIVTGNVIAAYEMIGHRPMFALADAAADLDAVYRLRRGGKGSVSELLMKETTSLTDEQILAVIAALTGALDGVYTDEASAVKMSIMKAIKVVA